VSEGIPEGGPGGRVPSGERGRPPGETGPVQVRATVLTVRRVDAYRALTLVAPAIAARSRPGQFITIAVGGPETPMLARRAFAVHDVRPDHGGTIEFVFEISGPGTRWLAGLRARDVLDVAGPLGRPFPLPKDPSSCLLLGVGYGSAPLFALAARLRERGCSVDFLLGAQSADRVFGALTARRSGRSATVTTSDGSFGARGAVTDMLEQVIREARTDVVYASAPVPVLREVTALASKYDIPVQASVDLAMACGTGICMGCVLPVTGTDGITRMLRSCVDGPVFRGDLVRWDDVGTIPADAFGAPGWPRAKGSQGSGREREERESHGGSARAKGGRAAKAEPAARGERGAGEERGAREPLRDREMRGAAPPGQQSQHAG
jgi:dihydroorotate dehydrogenase electron transfer subunit